MNKYKNNENRSNSLLFVSKLFCVFLFFIFQCFSAQIHVSGKVFIYVDPNETTTILNSEENKFSEIKVSDGAKIVESKNLVTKEIPKKTFLAQKKAEIEEVHQKIAKKIDEQKIENINVNPLSSKNSFHSCSSKSLFSVVPASNSFAKIAALFSDKPENHFQNSQSEKVALYYADFLVSREFHSSYSVRPPPTKF